MTNRTQIIEAQLKVTGTTLLLSKLIIKVKQKNPNHPMLQELEKMRNDLIWVDGAISEIQEDYEVFERATKENKHLSSELFKAKTLLQDLTNENELLKKMQDEQI